MRQIELAHIVVKICNKQGTQYLFRKHEKWKDWSLVGGHVDPGEEGDWARTAIREAEEELAPLKHRDDFIIVPLLPNPETWGPVDSKSAGVPTTYTAQFFALIFTGNPDTALARLPENDFLLVPEAHLYNSPPKFGETIQVLRRRLDGSLNLIPLASTATVGADAIQFHPNT